MNLLFPHGFVLKKKPLKICKLSCSKTDGVAHVKVGIPKATCQREAYWFNKSKVFSPPSTRLDNVGLEYMTQKIIKTQHGYTNMSKLYG